MLYTNTEVIPTHDDDFFDCDCIFKGSDTLAIILHGLEGHTRRSYITGMTHTLTEYDIIAMNFRGCSNRPNKLEKWYHSGLTDDVRTLIKLKAPFYKNIILIGFSVGGNIIFKYLGEEGTGVLSSIRCAVGISVVTDLRDSALVLSQRRNRMYMNYFLKSFYSKIKMKEELFPSLKRFDFKKIRNFHDYDNAFTIKLCGFSSVEEYWKTCSSRYFLSQINVPVLSIVSADDPFISRDGFPLKEASLNDNFTLEITEYGGHGGFLTGFTGNRWYEKRTEEFIRDHLPGENMPLHSPHYNTENSET